MARIEYVNGDLLKMAGEGAFDYIVHGCNCYNAMGGGIARAIAEMYPRAQQVDNMTGRGDLNKLGHFTLAVVNSIIDPSIEFTIINAYTQAAPSSGEDVFEYNHFRRICTDLNDCIGAESAAELDDLSGDEIAPRKIPRIGFPLIGAGLAGGDWNRIEKIIEDSFDGDKSVTVVRYSQTSTKEQHMTNATRHVPSEHLATFTPASEYTPTNPGVKAHPTSGFYVDLVGDESDFAD